MTTPQQSQADLRVVTGAAAAEAGSIAGRLTGAPELRRAALLETVPAVIDYYAVGSATLASDFYDERRELAGAKKTYTTELVINDRTVKIRRAVAWASDPYFSADRSAEDSVALVRQRLDEIVQAEVATPYRDTILTNTNQDPSSAGWQRITGVCCRFCRMLADRGAVYREATASFAAHPNCDCTAAPVFTGGELGPEASVIQYLGSRRSKTPAQKARLKDYLDANYPA